MHVVWLENKRGQTNGTVSIPKQGTIALPGGGTLNRSVQVFFTEASRGMIAVPAEDVNEVLICGCPSSDAKARAIATGGRAPECESLWMVAENQSPPKKVRDGTRIVDAQGKRVS